MICLPINDSLTALTWHIIRFSNIYSFFLPILSYEFEIGRYLLQSFIERCFFQYFENVYILWVLIFVLGWNMWIGEILNTCILQILLPTLINDQFVPWGFWLKCLCFSSFLYSLACLLHIFCVSLLFLSILSFAIGIFHQRSELTWPSLLYSYISLLHFIRFLYFDSFYKEQSISYQLYS